ncbi:Transcriptional enhancer factor TEF-1 [Geodia barretti]|uniref:Transcriptional enhancer factor TEF-1 n=1 Tax=Geodia barretti TaxID=519541 RepID=A0AA35TCC0_GEOBA|nr:Transcriptional enhancer factor TEF-1 [Geodia barretti]
MFKSHILPPALQDQAAKEKAMAGLSTMSSAQIVSASSLQNAGAHRMFGTPGITGNPIPMHTMLSPTGPGGSPVLVKHELINPAAAGLIWHPSLSQAGQQFIPASSMATTVPQLQVARAPGLFVTSQQANVDLSQPPASEEERGKTPFVIANPAGAMGDTPTAIPHLPPPNLPLKMVEFLAFVDKSKSENENDKKHGFVNISPNTSFIDPHMEAVDILHIADKFPENNGGLKDLFEKGPRDRFFLVKFWADIDTDLLDDSKAFYGVTSQYESSENMTISCSTKVCSFGKQVVEKVETEYARFDNGRFVYRINRSPMCDYMVSFIHRLKHLPERYMMNSVLENFTILQVVTNRDTQETLLCLAFVFEVCSTEDGSKHHVYRLIKNSGN